MNDLDVKITSEYTDNIESNALLIQIASHERLDLENAKYILGKEFEALMTIPLSNATMKNIRSLLEIDYLKMMSTLERRSKNLAENFHLFGNIDLEQNYVNRIRKISQYDIMEISKKYFKKNNQVILNVYKK